MHACHEPFPGHRVQGAGTRAQHVRPNACLLPLALHSNAAFDPCLPRPAGVQLHPRLHRQAHGHAGGHAQLRRHGRAGRGGWPDRRLLVQRCVRGSQRQPWLKALWQRAELLTAPWAAWPLRLITAATKRAFAPPHSGHGHGLWAAQPPQHTFTAPVLTDVLTGVCVVCVCVLAGEVARLICKYRPRVPVLLVTDSPAVARATAPWFGLVPYLVEKLPPSHGLVEFEVCTPRARARGPDLICCSESMTPTSL